MTATPSPASLAAELADLRRRLLDLERGSRTGNTAITQGALIARDSNGDERARFGQLVDGTFGVSAQNIVLTDGTGQALSLGGSFFGVASQQQPAPVAVAAADPISYQAAGPEVTVTTLTGRILIVASARCTANAAVTDGIVAALQVRDADGAEVKPPDTSTSSVFGVAGAGAQPVTVPILGMVDGLTPGAVYRCRLLYGATGSGSAGSVTSASVVAWPL